MMTGQFKEEIQDTSRTENEYLPERKGSGRQSGKGIWMMQKPLGIEQALQRNVGREDQKEKFSRIEQGSKASSRIAIKRTKPTVYTVGFFYAFLAVMSSMV
ncbi:hypothetical protein [Leminorella grimontii]|uniref:hypothetical protein n=1 Tax=Leminorella grimontii TaxID=82981 RepID=UPI00321FCE8D